MKHMELTEFKTACLEAVRDKVLADWERPSLTQLFFELTSRCNLACRHCGSRCGPAGGTYLPKADVEAVLSAVRSACVRDGRPLPFVCLTGGEPMLHPDVYGIAAMVRDMGFRWGMTTNGTTVDARAARRLADAGMFSASVSIDGPERVHDALRRSPGAYAKAMRGIGHLAGAGPDIGLMVTTVVTKESIGLLDETFGLVDALPVDAWRISNIEPMGGALDHGELMLDREDYLGLFGFIRAKREANIPVTYGCCHYLGSAYEMEVRDWFFRCQCGTETMSVGCDGSILGCLDVPRTELTVQGNIHEDDVMDVWENGFRVFRQDLSARCGTCAGCPAARYCRGGSRHSYDYGHDGQRLCMRGILF